MNEHLIMFEEPRLEFRYEQRVADPRHGLALFGPYDADQTSKPSSLSYVVLGTPEGIEKFGQWSAAMERPSLNAPGANINIWPPFPGFEAAFCSAWPNNPVRSFPIKSKDLNWAARRKDSHERAFEVVNKYLESLRIAHKLDERIGVAVCVVPDEVWLNCRPLSRVSEPVDAGLSRNRKFARKAGQLEMFDKFDPKQYWFSPDFRRQLKARAMQYDIPVQIIRESTLRLDDKNIFGERSLTPLSDRMWNLSTALYYKCGGKPWRLATARDGVCYIGIAFRRTDDKTTACCAAQMFLNTGDGIVFLGEYGPWYSPKTKQFQLSRIAAKQLLQGVLQTYKELEGKELNEVFLHSRSTIGKQALLGFEEGCPENVNLVGVRVRAASSRQGVRLYRNGRMPVVRGTFWKLNNYSGMLWGSGFKPQLGTYDGWDVPIPLHVDVEYGDVPVERVAQDILGLTKLNYNGCKLGDSEPVTVKFSDAVGEILISNPTVSQRKPNFKYYI